MGRTAARLVAATAVMVLLATAATAAFPGRNGAVGFSWFSLNEPELGPSLQERAIRTVSPSTRAVRTVIGCRERDGVPVAGNCAIPLYADPAFSPDGRLIAFDAGPRLALVRPDGGGLHLLSPYGTKLAFVRRGGVWTMDANGGHLRRVPGASAVDVAWSPDGRRFTVHVFDSGVWTLRTDGSGTRQLVSGGVNATSSFDAGGVDWQPLH